MKPYYEEAGITIYHGDCREIEPAVIATTIVSDPPYGIGFDFSKPRRGRASGLSWGATGAPDCDRGWDNVVGDTQAFNPSQWLKFDEVILWGANNYSNQLPASRRWLVWDKRGEMTPDSQGDCELAWTNLDGVIRQFTHIWRGIVRAGVENVVNGGKLHPCQKPHALMAWCISMTKGAVILDPFMGSGTTLVAAKDLGRRAIGVEIEERYCEIAAKRLAQGVLDFGATVSA